MRQWTLYTMFLQAISHKTNTVLPCFLYAITVSKFYTTCMQSYHISTTRKLHFTHCQIPEHDLHIFTKLVFFFFFFLPFFNFFFFFFLTSFQFYFVHSPSPPRPSLIHSPPPWPFFTHHSPFTLIFTKCSNQFFVHSYLHQNLFFPAYFNETDPAQDATPKTTEKKPSCSPYTPPRSATV